MAGDRGRRREKSFMVMFPTVREDEQGMVYALGED
jgi:hypothetical protein